MAYWLAKSEPSVYSYGDLERERRTEWNGVHNATALLHLKRMRPGDELLFYHSGSERSAVGIARVAGAPHPDPNDDRGSWSVVIEPSRALARAVSLSEMRSDPALSDFILFRISRLSVMPVTSAQWKRILGAAGRAPPTQGKKAGSRSRSRVARPRKRGAT
ncbi:MAG TPA: EVE domain-containing protein [Thermoplasmata archaeon]|nr:EVE domain-containing protein [Thermoplasmata archaeon]